MSTKFFSKNTIIYAIETKALRYTSLLLIPLCTYYLLQEKLGLPQFLFIMTIILLKDIAMLSTLIRFTSKYERSNQSSILFGSSLSLSLITGLPIITSFSQIKDSFVFYLFLKKQKGLYNQQYLKVLKTCEGKIII